MKIDSKLYEWDELEPDFRGSSLLLGNGASRAVWDDFKYDSLLHATRQNYSMKLNKEDYQLFKALKTQNFEQVLGTLRSAMVASEALGIDPSGFNAPYERIRDALGEAVKRVHVSWETVGEKRLQTLNEVLSTYDFLFTTNYDLLVYWAVMQDPSEFRDYLWSGEFELTNTEIYGKKTKLIFLHGALHLYRAQSGSVRKAKKDNFGADLLLKFPYAFPDAEPLLISEGSSEDKLKSIYGSDYLSFGYSQLTKHEEPMVIFGQGLSESDQHLVDAIANWGKPQLAVSMRGSTKPSLVTKRKAELHDALPNADIVFYKAESHPLGDPSLKVEKEE